MSNLGIDDEFRKRLEIQREISAIVQHAKKEIKAISDDMRAEDKRLQEKIAQTQLIEIMIKNMEEEIRTYLDGKFSQSVAEEMTQLRKRIVELNERWDDYRSSFL